MKTKILIILLIFFAKFSFAQDVITKKNGDEINAKVTEVSTTEIKYKKTDNPDVVYTILKTDVFMIKYSNGTKDIFNESTPVTTTQTTTATTTNQNTNTTVNNTATNTATTTANTQSDCEKAESDAKNDYKANGAMWGTFFTTGLVSPVVGLIPAIACSSTKPPIYSLDIPLAYSTNDVYKKCYQDKAWGIKKSQTWTGYGSGVLVFLSVILIVVSTSSY